MSSPQSPSRLTSPRRFWFRPAPARTVPVRPHRLTLESLEDRLAPSVTTLVAPGTPVAPGPTIAQPGGVLQDPFGIAVDGSGNLYVSDLVGGEVDVWNPSNGKLTNLVSGLLNPYGVAVDASGNVLIANYPEAIEEWSPPAGSLPTILLSGYSPNAVAVDKVGDVYFVQSHELYELMKGASTPTAVANLSTGSTDNSQPTGIALDASGDVFIADPRDNTIKEVQAGATSTTVLINQTTGGFSGPEGVAVDSSGNVYIADTGNGAIEEWVKSSGSVITLVSGLSTPQGIAVDSNGNVFAADRDGSIQELVAPPKITTQPQNTAATFGQISPVTLSVAASSALPLSYQWQISTDNGATFTNLSDGSGVSGSTTSTLTLSGFASTGSAEYRVVITDSLGDQTTSNAATLTINPPPSFATQPVSEAATTGQTGSETFSVVAANGTSPYTYQWLVSKDGFAYSNVSNGSGISGASTPTLTISGSALPASTMFYEVAVTDANGVRVTSQAATLAINPPPSIATQPANQFPVIGQTSSETFSVVAANGTSPYTYQWLVSTNGTTFTAVSNSLGISGATTPTLTIAGNALPPSGTEYEVVVTDANGVSVTSNAATLTFITPLSISSEPLNAVANQNQSSSVSFTVGTSGGATPVAVQWQVSTNNGNSFSNLSNGNGVSGAASTTLTLSSFATAGLFEYRAVVRDASGTSLTSTPAILTVNPAPVISAQPQNEVATVGQSASESFTIAASGGTGTLSVQWQVSTDNGKTFNNLSDGNGITGSTSNTLTVSGLTTAGTFEYRAVVTDINDAQGTSNAATLTINAPPSIATQPANKVATTGQTSTETFSVVAANGTSPYTYQWLVSTNGTSFSNVPNGSGISGATTATLTIAGNALPPSGTEYRVMVTDANGVSVTSNAATLTFAAPPSISSQPQNAVASQSQSAPVSFTVGASGGAAPLAVQWQISTDDGNSFSNLSNGSGVSGATSTTLTLSSFATAGSFDYRAVVRDANGVTAISNPAILTVNPAPVISTEPQNEVATVGQSASESFTIAASGGTGTLNVQWQVSTDGGSTFTNLSDGNGITGSTTATLTVSGFAAGGSDEYRAVVTDANGATVTSTAAVLTINMAPSIASQPQNAAATVGQSTPVLFTIAASGGTAPVSVQWQVSTDNGSTFTNLSDGAGVAGSATPTLTVSSFPTAGTAEYEAIVTDANGVTAASSPATLTISPVSVNPNQSWLTQVYADLLHRPLDPSGLATWTNLLSQGASRPQVVLLIESSLEYRTDVVEALYTHLLNRPADPSGLNSFTTFLGNGGTAEQVEAAILASDEYFQLHGGTNDGFLAGVYQDVLNRSVDASGAQSWGLALAGGSTRDAVVQAILTSLEAETNEVQNLYSEFLHRPADQSGLNNFTTALQQGVANEVVLASILGSNEYFSLAEQA